MSSESLCLLDLEPSHLYCCLLSPPTIRESVSGPYLEFLPGLVRACKVYITVLSWLAVLAANAFTRREMSVLPMMNTRFNMQTNTSRTAQPKTMAPHPSAAQNSLTVKEHPGNNCLHYFVWNDTECYSNFSTQIEFSRSICLVHSVQYYLSPLQLSGASSPLLPIRPTHFFALQAKGMPFTSFKIVISAEYFF